MQGDLLYTVTTTLVIQTGVKQGYVLSTSLFILAVDVNEGGNIRKTLKTTMDP